jgi:hypothetical protein
MHGDQERVERVDLCPECDDRRDADAAEYADQLRQVFPILVKLLIIVSLAVLVLGALFIGVLQLLLHR